MRKLGRLSLSQLYRIPEKNFHDSAQTNGVEQHSEQSKKPLNQQQDFKGNWKVYMHCEWPAIKSIQAFLAGYTSLTQMI